MSVETELQLNNSAGKKEIKIPVNPIEQPNAIPRHVHNDADAPRIDLRDTLKVLQPNGTIFFGTIADAAGALPDPVDPMTGAVNPAWAEAVTNWLAEISFREQTLTNVFVSNRFASYDQDNNITRFDRL